MLLARSHQSIQTDQLICYRLRLNLNSLVALVTRQCAPEIVFQLHCLLSKISIKRNPCNTTPAPIPNWWCDIKLHRQRGWTQFQQTAPREMRNMGRCHRHRHRRKHSRHHGMGSARSTRTTAAHHFQMQTVFPPHRPGNPQPKRFERHIVFGKPNNTTSRTRADSERRFALTGTPGRFRFVAPWGDRNRDGTRRIRCISRLPWCV